MYVQASCHAKARLSEEEAFRFYIASAIQNINQILAENLSGKYMTVSYDDMIHPKPKEDKTGEEIIEHMKEKLRSL